MANITLAASGRGTNPVSILTTELNSLANNAAALSAAMSNGSDLDLYMDLELAVTYGTAPTAGTTVDVYLVRQIDGTNYEDASTTGPILPQNGYIGSFSVRAVTSAQRMMLSQIPCPPRDFKIVLVNNATGQSMASSGNTLKGYFYRLSVA